MTPERERFTRRALLALGGAGAVVAAGIAALRIGGRRIADDSAAALYGLTLPAADGSPYAIARLQGAPLLVNFWATWCGPCVAEMPALQQLAVDLRPRGIGVLGIAIDRPELVRPFTERLGVDYPIVVAGAGGMPLLRAMGGGGALPFTALIDRRGTIRDRRLGIVDVEAVRKRLLEFA